MKGTGDDSLITYALSVFLLKNNLDDDDATELRHLVLMMFNCSIDHERVLIDLNVKFIFCG